jgi:hypothetical protein
MRAIVLVAVVLTGCDVEGCLPRNNAPAVTAQQASANAGRVREECRDNCEQTAILTGASDEQLRACRARCDGQGATATPHEVPSRITRAPVTHAPPAVRPVQAH